MTTKVKIEITEAHKPVEVRVYSRGSEGILVHSGTDVVLSKVGDSIEYYVFDGQALEVHEVQP